MDSRILAFFRVFSLVLLRVLFVFDLPSSTANDFYTACTNNFNCGDITDVGFPFWGVGRPADCGHPALQMVCEGNETTIVLREVKYRVLKFSSDTQTLTIARTDYMDDLCPPKFVNTTLDYNLFDVIPEYENITLLYCSSFSMVQVARQFSCPGYDAGFVRVGVVEPGFCNASVTMPISLGSIEPVSGLVNSSETLKAINEGFEVKWKEDGVGRGCGGCEASYGVCGYDLNSNLTTCYCPGYSTGLTACPTLPAGEAPTTPSGNGNRNRNSKLKIIIGVCTGFTSILTLLCILVVYIHRRRVLSAKTSSTLGKEMEKMNMKSIMNIPGPRRYHYSEIRKMTNSFANKVGEGGYGTVYQGKLADGTLVAIKLLKLSRGSEDFINEVRSISITSHVNVVSLLGFSYDSKKTALVYEFMPNGSLDKFVSRSQNLEMKTLHRILVGVARGLEYLHCGCSTRIVHFDIKPQNILLDEDFNPKISDFGLAKLCKRKQSVISTLGTRGTAGFIAPEVFSRAFGVVSYKSDVYSYGMLVLDLISGGKRNPSSVSLSNESETYFPDWIFKNLEEGKTIKTDENIVEEEEEEEEEEEMEKKMIMVGLWCIQTSPLDRPSMSGVLEMLNGSIQSLQMPPKPSLIPPQMSSTQQSTYESLSYEDV